MSTTDPLMSTDGIANNVDEKRMELLKMSQAVNLIGSWEWDLEKNTLLWTDEMFLLRSAPVSADNFISLEENYSYIHSEDREMVKEKFSSLQDKEDVNFDYRIVTRYGETKIVKAWATMLRDENGKPKFIRGTSQDVTILRHTERQLRELNQAFQYAQEMANLGNWQLKLSSDTLVLSDNFYRILGCEPGEFQPTFENFVGFVHPDDRWKVVSRKGKSQNINQPYSSEYRVIRTNGEIRYIKSVNKLFIIDHEQIFFGTVQDVTEEYKLRRQLEEKISLAESLIENSVDLIAAYDMSQHCITWNKACEICFQKKKEDVLCRHFSEIFPDLEAFPDIEDLELALKGEYRYKTDQRLNNLEGFYEYYIIPLKKQNEEVFGALCIAHDLNEVKKSSDKLNQLNQSLEQKNQELERSNDELASFSYIASHDLQEPLRKIQTFSKIIMEKEFSGLSEKGRDYLERMESGALRMQGLIDDLLTFSRTSTYPRNFAPADLNNLLEDVKRELKDLIEEKNAIIESKGLPVANVIAFQFRQLMENLIINAIKYCKPDTRPHIVITSELVPASEINSSHTGVGKTYHKISVTDNGIGFEQEYSQRIFELFQRLHGKDEYPGTGLGLAICKKIIQNHHGFITAKGEPGVGATFTIYFP